MPTLSHRLRTPLPVLVAAVAVSAFAPPALSQSAAPRREAPLSVDGVGVPVVPSRRGMPAAVPVLPPLPTGAERLEPLTLRLTVRRPALGGRGGDVPQTVIRTVDRVHVAAPGGSEWLFERNPVDPRRVSGQRIEHASREIVVYTDTDLATMLGIPGWAHVLTLGCEIGVVATAPASAPQRTIDGVVFRRRPTAAATGPAAWWNEELLLPGDCSTADGSAQMVLDGVSRQVDVSLLAPPTVRFPAYREVSFADWLEHP